jgi:hypothetical protein
VAVASDHKLHVIIGEPFGELPCSQDVRSRDAFPASTRAKFYPM